MGLKLSRRQWHQLLNWAGEAGQEECCGLILGNEDEVQHLELATNVAIDKTVGFEIDPASLIAAERSSRDGGLQILGYFHSHPNGVAEPSSIDVQSAYADGRCWLIIAGKKIMGWRATRGSGEAVLFKPEQLMWG